MEPNLILSVYQLVLLFATKRVPNGHSIPAHPVAAELFIVIHEIHVRLGSHKETSMNIHVQPSPQMRQEMIAAGVVRAACESAVVVALVKT